MEYIEFAGIAAFAVSGAMAAADRHADIFGVLFLGLITALGGGVLRDVLLGVFPPRMFTSYGFVAVALAAGLAVFLEARANRGKYEARREKLDAVVNVFDAAGLAAFTVSGADIAIGAYGFNSALLPALMGMTTGVGGGMLRDVLLGEMPVVLRKRIYAVASLTGAALYFAMLLTGCGRLVCAWATMIFVFALRMMATRFRWDLPRT